jgi:hypothetical protein
LLDPAQMGLTPTEAARFTRVGHLRPGDMVPVIQLDGSRRDITEDEVAVGKVFGLICFAFYRSLPPFFLKMSVA